MKNLSSNEDSIYFWEVYLTVGRKHYSKFNFDEAKDKFNKALEKNVLSEMPEEVKILLRLLRGVSNFHLKKYKDSAIDLFSTIQKQSEDYETGNNIPLWFFINKCSMDNNLKDLSLVIKSLNILLEFIKNKKYNIKFPKYKIAGIYDIYWSRAYCNGKLGNTKNSLFDFKNALLNKPPKDELCWLYADRSRVHIFYGKGKDALNDIEKSISLNDQCFRAYLNKGILFNKKNNFKEAKNTLELCLKIMNTLYYQPYVNEVARAYLHRGFSKIRLKELEKGIDDIGEAFLLDKKCAEKYRESIFNRLSVEIKNILKIKYHLNS